jgi:hypothetical protein
MSKAIVSRRSALALGAGALVVPKFAFAAPKPPVLVELFTSQGCSSCPPADKFAGELTKDPDVLVLSFNVDYWDYLGWRDTLAKPEYSQRQYDYARARGDGSVYTPQMVVNGADHAVGSQSSSVRELIQSAQAKPLAVDMKMSMTDKDISVTIGKSDYAGDATLWLMSVAPQVAQKIERGENTGKDIVYHNVVRNLVPAAMWKGEAYQGSWMKDTVMTPDCKHCVAVLQSNKVGPILGIAQG